MAVISLWWLRYNRGRRLLGIAIIEASSLISARMKADADGISPVGAEFAEGHELDDRTAKQIPADQVGRMLTPAQASAILDHVERPKRR
jgi:hypothetical protein